MTRLALIAAIVALAFASTASGTVYAIISANWNDSKNVMVTVGSDHRFSGAVSDTCAPTTGPTVTQSAALGQWVFNQTSQQYTDDVTFDMSAAGPPGASCTIVVTDGHKTLRSQSYVST